MADEQPRDPRAEPRDFRRPHLSPAFRLLGYRHLNLGRDMGREQRLEPAEAVVLAQDLENAMRNIQNRQDLEAVVNANRDGQNGRGIPEPVDNANRNANRRGNPDAAENANRGANRRENPEPAENVNRAGILRRDNPADVRPSRKRVHVKEEVISDSEASPLEKETEYDFLSSSISHDRVLIIEGSRIHVESRYLSVWSEFFQSLFTNDSFREAGQSEIPVALLTKEEMLLFLRVIYPGTFAIKHRNFAKLMSIGYRLMSNGLIAKCRRFYQDHFHELDKYILFKLAFEYDISDLKRRISMEMRRSKYDNEGDDEPKVDLDVIKNDWIPMVSENKSTFTPEMAKFVMDNIM